MATGDLVTLAQATAALTVGGFTAAPQWNAGWSAWLPSAITAASHAAQRYAQRIFALTNYDEIRTPRQGQWDKNEPDVVVLQNLPVAQVTGVRGGRTSALLIGNTDAITNQDATVTIATTGDPGIQLWPTGVILSRTASGQTFTTSYPLFVTPSTVGFTAVASGTGGTISTGTYLVSYTLLNAQGESLRSPDVSLFIASGQTLTVMLTTLPPTAALGANIYVSAPNGPRQTESLQANIPAGSTTATITSITFGAPSPPSSVPVVVNDLAAAIEALGGGWDADVQPQYGLWGLDKLYGPYGPTGALQNTPGGEARGASLDVFASSLNGWDIDQGSGTLYLTPQSGYAMGGPGAAYQWPMSTVDYPQGGWRYEVRVQYTAGFTLIPLAVQQAVCEILKAMFERLTTDTTLQAESIGVHSFTAFAANTLESLPSAARQLLDGYRVYRA